MKRMELFCTSPVSTAVYTSLDQCSVRRHGTRTHQHPERSPRPWIQTHVPIPCTSYQLAITPRPKSHYNDLRGGPGNGGKRIAELGRRKSCADACDLIGRSPMGSSRYLLSDKPFDGPVPETRDRSGGTLVPVQPVAGARHSVSCDGSPSLKASYPARSRDQVVVLRVSLHCKGCESKVRKHLSRMEGVTSFSIDFEKKKVTVRGELSPASVLARVSRVKNAQLLWPTLPSSSSPSSSSASSSSALTWPSSQN
ncbi:hypothetical protein MLD38_017332 [Melastoma candidum]|uniref:Uncharacterized protein n=1 Tax=Melastoma candidum TaxID=119954 RepID=A0ACB9QPP7_9MYRT|nr:hypothetical protein MLD38_017332 [Melastoma candidum]